MQREALSKFSNLHQYLEDPRTFVEIRNDFVHPSAKHGPISLEVQGEAWNLGQWYIELLLLKLIGYKGRYWNRTESQFDTVT